jgi:hypothetical protein
MEAAWMLSGDDSFRSDCGAPMITRMSISNQAYSELAELTCSIVPSLPYELIAHRADDPARSERVMLERRHGDEFVARWPGATPARGSSLELRLAGAGAVYLLSAVVTGPAPEESCRLVRITELRRKKQRRTSPRAEMRDLVVVSHEADVDGDMIDVSASGVAFLLDRPLDVGVSIRLVLNIQGSVISTRAEVRQAQQLSGGNWRLGCEFTQISDVHRHRLGRFAADNPIDRRTAAQPDTLRSRITNDE